MNRTELLNKITFGISPLTERIYMGWSSIRKTHRVWTTKRDVTDELLGMVAEFMLINSPNGTEIELTKGGKLFAKLTVVPITESSEEIK